MQTKNVSHRLQLLKWEDLKKKSALIDDITCIISSMNDDIKLLSNSNSSHI